MKLQNAKKILLCTFCAIVLVIISSLVTWNFKLERQIIEKDFPAYVNPVDPTIGLSCKSVVGSIMNGGDTTTRQSITAEVFDGTDVIAVEVNEEGKFIFLTRASVEIGETGSNDDWNILQNSDSYLITSLTNINNEQPDNSYIDTFYLDKRTGMALWTKTNSSGLMSNTPNSQSYILKCQ